MSETQERENGGMPEYSANGSDRADDKQAEDVTLENAVTKKKRFPIWVIAVIAVVAVALIVATVSIARSSIRKKRVAEKLELARKYVSELNYEQAIIAYKAAIRIDPKNADLYIELADTYIEAGMDDEAIELLKKAQDKVSEDDEDRIRKKLKKVRDGENNDSGLTDLIDKLRSEDDPEGSNPGTATAGIEEGDSYLENMEYDKALEVYEEAAGKDSQDIDALLGIVEVYIRQRDYETALKKAQEYYDQTGDGRFLEKIEMLQMGDVSDSKGRMLKKTYYGPDGSIVFWHEYSYDLNGRQNRVTSYNSEGTETSHVDLEYDENHQISYWWASDSGEVGKIEYFRENGKTVRTNHYDRNGEINQYEKYFYNDDGRLSYTLKYNMLDEVNGKEENFYDENGREIRKNFYWVDNEGEVRLTSYQTREYDENGRLIKYSGFNSNGDLEWYDLYEIDEEGNTVEYRYNADGELKGIWK